MLQALSIKKEYMRYSFMSWFGVMIAFLASKFIASSYNGNIDEANKIAQELLLNPAMAQPEPKEKAIFFGTVIITVLGLLVFYFVLNRFIKKNDDEIKDSSIHFISVINILIVGYFLYNCFITANPFFATPQNSHDTITKTNFDFYFIQSFLHKRLLIYVLFLFPLIGFILIKNFKVSEQLNSLFKKVVLAICLGFGLLALAISTFKFPYTFENKYDFNAIYYSVVQVFNGAPLLVDGFTNTYGMYPHFLMPILKLTGLSVLSFSLIMGVLLCICFYCLYYFLNKNITNKLILLLGFCSVFFMSYGYQKSVLNYDSIFAMHPIRWLFPMLLFAYITYYITKQTSQSFLFRKFNSTSSFEIIPIKAISFFLFSFGILWSPDFGTFSFLTLIVFYVFYEFNMDDIKNSIIKTLFTFIQSIITLAIALFIYSSFIKLFYNQSPDLSLLFKAIITFSGIGFGMLPMPTTMHPWMLVAMVYVIGWAVSIHHFFTNQKNSFTLSVFVLTFLGTIGLTYYQGRSHNWNLFVTNFEAFILLALFADKLVYKTRENKVFIPAFAMSLFFIAFSPFQLAGSFPKLQELIYSKKDRTTNQMEQNNIEATANSINAICNDAEKIFIVSAIQYQGIYHTLSKTTSVANPGFGDLFTKQQQQHIIDKLKTENQKIFLEPQFYQPTDTKLLNTIGAYYQLNAIENMPSLYYYKKKEFAKYQPKLNSEANTLFYINTNKKGDENLKLYEAASKPIQLGNAFTIDVVFTPPSNTITNINTGGTIVSNLDGNKGFVIQQQQQNPNQYIFAFKGRGIVCNVELNKPTKMTFKVDGVNLSCYVNDVLQSQAMVTEGYENSNQFLCIGSIQNKSNFFLGNVDEVRIENK